MDTIELLRNRRTIRKYSEQPVSDEMLRELLEVAFRAPTTGGMQLYSVIVTRNHEMKQKLSPLHFNQPTVVSAPVVLTFCADYNRFVKWCEASNATPDYDNFASFTTAMIDALLVAQQFNTAAEAVGLGCCYLGTTTYNAPQIADVLQLPRRVVPVTTLTVGFPVDVPQQVERLPIDAIIHEELYNDYSVEDIHRYYEEKELLPTNKRFVEENGKETLAQVFTDVRYTRKDNEYFSRIWRDFIAAQGFE